MRRFGPENFLNNSAEVVLVDLRPGDRILVRGDSGNNVDSYVASGEEFGYELELHPGEAMEIIELS